MPGISTFLISFGICLVLMAPGLTFGDSGELAAAAWSTGVAHPPGYPGWMVPARVFTLLPFGSVAFRTNLFSAVCAALAAALVSSVVARSGGRFVTAVACGLGLLLNPGILRSATVTEVYTLNLLFFALSIWIASRFGTPSASKSGENPVSASKPGETSDSTAIEALALVSGLAIANHTTALALVPPWIFMAFRAGRLKSSIPAFIVGAALILAMPAASLKDPAMNWGRPTTLSRFSHTITRAQYGEISKDPRSASSLLKSAKAFAAEIVWPWLVFPAGFAVVVAGAGRRFGFSRGSNESPPVGTVGFIRTGGLDPAILMTLWIAAVFSAGLLFITNPGDTGLIGVVAPFFLPLVLSCWVGAGLAAAFVNPRRQRDQEPGRFWSCSGGWIIPLLFVGAAALGLGGLAVADRSWDFTAPRFCRDIVTVLDGGGFWTATGWSDDWAPRPVQVSVESDSLSLGRMAGEESRKPSGKILFTDHDDNFFPLVYARACTLEFPPFLPICRQFLSLSWYFDELRERHPDLGMTNFEIPLRDVEAISARRVRDILVSNAMAWETWFILNYAPDTGTGFSVLPFGLLFRVVPGRPGSGIVNRALNLSLTGLSNSRGWPVEFTAGRSDPDTVEAMRYYCLSAINLGIFALDQEEAERAARFFSEALTLTVPGKCDDAARAAMGLGKALLASRDYAGALDAFAGVRSDPITSAEAAGASSRSALMPVPGEVRYQEGLALLGLGRVEEASAAVREALRLGRIPDPIVAGRLGIVPMGKPGSTAEPNE